MSQMASQRTGFDGMGMAPMTPMSSSQPMQPTGVTTGHNSVFGAQQQNLLFGAAPMSGGFQPNKKNPFS